MKDYILIHKYGNMFYVENDDIIIIHFLLNYGIKNNKIYFSDIEKVIENLNSNHINYKFDRKLVTFIDNKYTYYLSNGQNKINLFYLVKDIKSKINCLNLNDKIILLRKIDEYINER